MPKGVEHGELARQALRPDAVPNSVMPKGVEHLYLAYPTGESFT